VVRFTDSTHRIDCPGFPRAINARVSTGNSYAAGDVLDRDTAVPAGFVGDSGGLDMFADYVSTTFNADLNGVLDVQPTSERIAEHLAGWFAAHARPRQRTRFVRRGRPRRLPPGRPTQPNGGVS